MGAKGGARPSRPAPDADKVKAIEGAEITQEDADAVEGWMGRVFYAKKDSANSMSKETFFKIFDAAKAFGYEGEWGGVRDWIKGLIEAKSDAATGKVAKVLALAGQITLKNTVSVNKVQHTEAERKALAFFENNKQFEVGLTLSDLQASVPEATEGLIEKLVDGAFLYETMPGKWRLI